MEVLEQYNHDTLPDILPYESLETFIVPDAFNAMRCWWVDENYPWGFWDAVVRMANDRRYSHLQTMRLAPYIGCPPGPKASNARDQERADELTETISKMIAWQREISEDIMLVLTRR